MANSSAQTVKIDLSETNLNMNRLQTEVKQFSGFNKCNGVPFGGMLKPFEKSESDLTSDAVIGADGVKYSIVNNHLVGSSDENSVDIPLYNLYLKKQKANFKYLNYPKVYNIGLFDSTIGAICAEDVNGDVKTYFCSITNNNEFRPTGAAAYLTEPNSADVFVDTRCFRRYGALVGAMLFNSGTNIKYLVYRYVPSTSTLTVKQHTVTIADFTPTRLTINVVDGRCFVAAIDETNEVIKTIVLNETTLERFNTTLYEYAPMVGYPYFVKYRMQASNPTTGLYSIPLYYYPSVTGTTITWTQTGVNEQNAPNLDSTDNINIKTRFVGDVVNHSWCCSREHLFVSLEKDYANNMGGCAFFQCAMNDEGDLVSGYKARIGDYLIGGVDVPVYLLINNNYISGISYKNTLLTDWNDVDTDKQVSVSQDNCICYADSQGVFYIISPDTPKLKLVDNRFVITNSVAEIRGGPSVAYDTVEHKAFSFALDWNNRFIGGNAKAINSSSSVTYEGTVTGPMQIVSAVNPIYEITNNPFPGAIFNPQVVHEKFIPNIRYPSTSGSAEVDFFYGPATDVSVPYKKSLTKHKIIRVNPELIGTTYPTDTNGNIMYCPSMFSEFVRSYNNNSMVVCGSTAYPLNYYNNKAIFSYYLLSAVEGAKHAFSIQGGQYIVTEDQIFSASYSGGVVSVVDSVAYVKDYIYLGADQFKALFYCPFNRVIYSFTGDRLLSEFAQSDKITDIYSTGYNFHSQSIYLSTNDGVYIITGNGICRVDSPAISDFYFKEKSVVMMSADKMIEYSIVDNLTTKLPLELETMFYGAGSEKNSVIDTWYLRLVNNGSSDKEIELYVKALTDKGTTTEIKKLAITKEMWDKETDTILVRYQPKLQRGVGVAFGYKGPFPIQSLTCSVNSQPETTSSKVAI